MEQTTKKTHVNTETLASQLKEWGIDLKRFKARAGKASGDAKVKLESKVAVLQTHLDEGRNKLEELRKSGKAASGEMEIGVEAARASLEKAFAKAKTEFEQSGSQAN